MTDRIDFEIAKVLKDKGWTKNTYSDCWVKTLDGDIIHNKDRKDCIEHDRCKQYLMQPTIPEVVMWLYENHHIWIGVSVGQDGFNSCIQRVESEYELNDFTTDTPTESYLEAIKYTLTHLL